MMKCKDARSGGRAITFNEFKVYLFKKNERLVLNITNSIKYKLFISSQCLAYDNALVISKQSNFYQSVLYTKIFDYFILKMSSKSFKEINPLEPVHSQVEPQEEERIIDWKLCILCQEQKNESLQCPTKSKRKDTGAGYRSTAENVQRFDDLGMMPFDVRVSQLDDGSGLYNTLMKNEASWHKSCKDLVNNTKLKRAEK